MGGYKRRGGNRWRLLVHGLPRTGEVMNHAAYHVSSHPQGRHPEIEDSLAPEDQTRYIELPHTEFDELVVGQWCHIEQMDDNRWWMNIAGVTLWVTTDRDGRPRKVSTFDPGDYALAEDGCEYLISGEPFTPRTSA